MAHSVDYACIANSDMTRLIMLIKLDRAEAWLCYVLCNEGSNDALKECLSKCSLT